MRIRDWYFQGWERREEAGGKSTLVYTAERYTLPADRPKRTVGIMTAALLVLYALVALLPSAGGMWSIAAIAQLLEIIPLVYLVMGAVRLLAVREPMTYRDYHASWRRTAKASVVSAVFTAAMAVTQIAYLILFAGGGMGVELLYLFAELCCFALSLLLCRYIKCHPCTSSKE